MTAVQRYSAPLPPPDLREVLRYAACRTPDERTLALAASAAEEGAQVLRPALCYLRTPVQVRGEEVDLGFVCMHTAGLARALEGCEEAVVFGATLGLGLDRLIARYGRTSPSRGLMLQAYGAERIEALCDAFCAQLPQLCAPLQPRRRFSPGYGDLPLAAQRSLFAALDCHRQIGLYLNESLLMSPTKSVTAIAGLSAAAQPCAPGGCAVCTRQDCSYRKE